MGGGFDIVMAGRYGNKQTVIAQRAKQSQRDSLRHYHNIRPESPPQASGSSLEDYAYHLFHRCGN